MSNFKERQSFKKLSAHYQTIKNTHMRQLFSDDANRFDTFSAKACGIELDYSKNRITTETFNALIDLVKESDVEQKRDAMFSGEKINTSEDRAVLHTALRNKSTNAIFVESSDIMLEVNTVLKKMERFVEEVHQGKIKGFTDKVFTDVLAIGIGGSYLGPKTMTDALTPYQKEHIKVHYVANVDGSHINDVLNTLDIETTLVVMSSKSFGTQETVKNTETTKSWFLENGGSFDDIAKHFICVSSNIEAATEFGIDKDNIFPMWDWVGGRYSIWSAIGLPVALALGFEHFNDLLNGAYEMDLHFKTAPLEQNLPVIMAMIGVWYVNFFGAQNHALLPYDHYLREFPSYIQQLDMESNGKSATPDGQYLDYATGPIIWGGEGTNGQHAFHQLIHQGNVLIPADFIFPLTAHHTLADHHAMLASNCFGQTQALMKGKTLEEVKKELSAKGVSDDEILQVAPQRVFEGNKPSNTLLMDQVTPKTLGSLIALYEHKVFVQGVIWGVNSFDQWGVELGKELGNQVLDAINNPNEDNSDDSSTHALIARFSEIYKQKVKIN